MDEGSTKVCNHCHEAKPLTEFGKRSQSPDGREYRCSACYNTAYFEGTVEHKVCTQCDVDKPASEFQKRSASKDGLQPRCRACVKGYLADYFQANREHKIDQMKAYESRNREAVNARHRRWIGDAPGSPAGAPPFEAVPADPEAV